MANSKKLIAIVGPTGSGKTALATRLAEEFNGVIISADSRQIYRGLDIGTNKEPLPQLLVDIVDPGARFTLHDWLEAARLAVEDVWTEGKLPVVVGGTGLYVTALLEGYQPGEGRHSKKRYPVDFESLVLMPDVKREELYQRSDRRYEKIFDALITETKQLIEQGADPEWLINLGLDYRFAALFITGQRNRELAITEFQQESRHYIRRQLTWWRHHGKVETVQNSAEAAEKVGQFLRNQE